MQAPCGVEVEIGQKWQEVDPRFDERIVEVVGFGEVDRLVTTRSMGITSAHTEKVPVIQIKSGGRLLPAKVAFRTTQAKLSRFNGKRGGYKLVVE